jgi:DnaJ-domain-containing protein 1
MKNGLMETGTPEERELLAKKAELDRLSVILADKELDLEDIRLSVARFQHRYFAEIGNKYVRLDELRAQIAELRARRSPQDSGRAKQAQVAREEASRTAKEYQASQREPEPPPEKRETSDEIKRLYRKIAAIVHPDKGTDEQSRKLRTRLMAELNDAYARKDGERMRSILLEWEQSPDAVPGKGIAADLVRTIRAIAQVKRRIVEIEKAIAAIVESDIHQLMVRVHQADVAGRNTLVEMAESLDSEVEQAEQELKSL